MTVEYDVKGEWRTWHIQAIPVVIVGSIGFGWWAQSVGAGLFALALLMFLSEATFKVGIVADAALRTLNPPN